MIFLYYSLDNDSLVPAEIGAPKINNKHISSLLKFTNTKNK